MYVEPATVPSTSLGTKGKPGAKAPERALLFFLFHLIVLNSESFLWFDTLHCAQYLP